MNKPVKDMNEQEREAFIEELRRRGFEHSLIHGAAGVAAANLVSHLSVAGREAYLMAPGEYYGQSQIRLPGGAFVDVRVTCVVILRVPT